MATTTFNDLITFSRGSNATVTGPNGLIQWAPSNLLTNSQDFEAAAWTKLNATVTANTAVAPDGTTTADTLTTSGVATAQRIGQNPTNTGISTFSIYVKAGTAQFVQLIHSSDGNAYANFDVSSGTLGTQGTGSSSTITSVGNGWYRCTLTFNIASSTFWYAYIAPSASAAYGASFTATVADLRIWGAQLELGSTATTYNNTSVRNLLGFSEAFDNATWTKTNSSIVTGAQANPINGLFNAQKLMEDTASSGHQVNQTVTTTANPFTFSAYLKPAGRNWVALALTDSGSTLRVSYFDLANGATGTVATGITASIVPVGSGWYRCAVTVASAVAGNNTIRIYLSNANNTTTYTGDGNSGVYIYGAQLSNSASLDPYVPTPGAAPSSTAYYGPRFDYDPVTLAARGLLVEEARTNLLLYSEQFGIGAGSWPTASVSITSNTTTAPDGTLTADTMTVTSTGQFRYVNQVLTLTNGVTYTLTVYLKYKTARYVWLLGETNVDAFAIFDLLTGTVGSVSAGVTRSITAVGNGWYRCSATFTVSSATAPNQVGFGLSDTDTVITPPATAGIDTFLWGAQLEVGTFATSYIPTIASTVTRSADVATITGSLFSQWYNQPEGAFIVDFDTPQDAAKFVFSVSDGTNNNRVQVLPWSSRQGQIVTGGVDQALFDNGTITLNTPTKIALTYKANDAALSLGGATPATDTSCTIPTIDRLLFGNATSGTDQTGGHIRSIRYAPVRAADFQLQALTELPLVPTLDADFINNLYEA